MKYLTWVSKSVLPRFRPRGNGYLLGSVGMNNEGTSQRIKEKHIRHRNQPIIDDYRTANLCTRPEARRLNVTSFGRPKPLEMNTLLLFHTQHSQPDRVFEESDCLLKIFLNKHIKRENLWVRALSRVVWQVLVNKCLPPAQLCTTHKSHVTWNFPCQCPILAIVKRSGIAYSCSYLLLVTRMTGKARVTREQGDEIAGG